jgi:hypothetical protein
VPESVDGFGAGAVRAEIKLAGDRITGISVATNGGPPVDHDASDDRAWDAALDLLDVLHDVEVHVEAHTDRGLVVRTKPGILAHLPARTAVTATVVCAGPPGSPRLCQPLVLTAGGAGVRLGLSRVRWLAELARLRVRSATLHPDGEVRLDGSAIADSRVLLRTAARALTELVRRNPRFARLRGFLADPVTGSR